MFFVLGDFQVVVGDVFGEGVVIDDVEVVFGEVVMGMQFCYFVDCVFEGFEIRLGVFVVRVEF